MNLLSSLRSCISNQCCTNGNFGLDYTNYECKYFAKFKKHHHHDPDHHHFQHHSHHKHHSYLNNLSYIPSYTDHKHHNQSHTDHKYHNQSHNHIHQHNVSHQNEHHLENLTYPGNHHNHNNAKNLNSAINGSGNNKNIWFPSAEINSHKTSNKEAQKEKITLTLPARSSRSSPSITIITVAAMISIMAQ